MRPRDGVDVRAEVARHADTELRALWQLYRDGVVREMYSPAGPGAMLVLEAESVKEAERLVAQLPSDLSRRDGARGHPASPIRGDRDAVLIGTPVMIASNASQGALR